MQTIKKMKIKKSTKKEIEQLVSLTEDKYRRLVWFARRSDDTLLVLNEDGVQENKLIMDKLKQIQELYPTEIEDLMGDDGDWAHGFNSGMLAGMRYVMTLAEMGQEYADEWFPELDT
jgi:hypothetical protein